MVLILNQMYKAVKFSDKVNIVVEVFNNELINVTVRNNINCKHHIDLLAL